MLSILLVITSVFLKFGESMYVAMDLIPILLDSLPLAHNVQHSLVIYIRTYILRLRKLLRIIIQHTPLAVRQREQDILRTFYGS